MSTSSSPEGDVISLVNDAMVKTVEVPDIGTFEPSLATDSNLTEVELPEQVNVLFLRTANECNLTSDAERDLKQLLLNHSDTFAKDPTDLGFVISSNMTLILAIADQLNSGLDDHR